MEKVSLIPPCQPSFSRRSSRPRDWTQLSCIVGRRFTLWATREANPPHPWCHSGRLKSKCACVYVYTERAEKKPCEHWIMSTGTRALQNGIFDFSLHLLTLTFHAVRFCWFWQMQTTVPLVPQDLTEQSHHPKDGPELLLHSQPCPLHQLRQPLMLNTQT